MGYSAGGHLALLYAYMAKQGYYNYGDKIKLVISEAGPTDFTGEGFNNLADQVKAPVMALVNNNASRLSSASPITYANANAPYTILMYGNGYVTSDLESDGLVFYTQGTDLNGLLSPYSKSSLFTFNTNPEGDSNYNHNSFKEDNTPNENGEYNTTINPKNSYGEIDDYYEKIQEKLDELKRN